MPRSRLRSTARVLARTVVSVLAVLLIIAGVALALLESAWGKDRLRALIVDQANRRLTATLQIGRLEGSLFSRLRLSDIRLIQDGQTVAAVDAVALDYSVRGLWQGITIRRLTLTKPRIVAYRRPDGRWNLATLLRREAAPGRRAPGRPIDIQTIEIADATVTLRDPLQFGAAHLPTEYDNLDAVFSLAFRPAGWTIDFTNLSFAGRAPDLAVTAMSGGLGGGSDGISFDSLAVTTPGTAFALDGRIARGAGPATLNLQVDAERFAFQAWGGILPGLRNIAVEAAFDAHLTGPLDALVTTLHLEGTGGAVDGTVTLNTRVPGWRGIGDIEIARIDLARWFDNPSKHSEITGRLRFDLDLNLGHAPRGTYVFDGPHAMFMSYAADQVHADGRITETAVQIGRATGLAYGARVAATAGSSIGLAAPYRFSFAGSVAALDLRNLPSSIPVPHVESALSFAYEVAGQFADAFIDGRAAFQPSVFLGARVGAGATGTIDTHASPYAYAGEGDLEAIDINRFGRDLDVAWMRDPRWAGEISGRFTVRGTGGSAAALAVSGGGRLARADLFGGSLTDATVGIEIANGTLTGSFDGALAGVNPAIAMSDARLDASLTGTAALRATVAGLLLRAPQLADYEVSAHAALERSTIRGFPIERARIDSALAGGVLQIDALDVSGPALTGTAEGRVSFTDEGATHLEYRLARVDLQELERLIGFPVGGEAATTGRVSGPYRALALAGTASLERLETPDFSAKDVTGQYDVTIPSGDVREATARLAATAAQPTMLGRTFQKASGTLTLAGGRVGFDLGLSEAETQTLAFQGDVVVHQQALDLIGLTVTIGETPWRLARQDAPPIIAWTGERIAVQPLLFLAGAAGEQQIAIAGDWQTDGAGRLTVRASHVHLETLAGAPAAAPPRYGGVMDLDAVVSGTRQAPVVTGPISIVDGRVERISYEKLAGRVDYANQAFAVDLRLDQAPGVWLTAVGSVPRSLFSLSAPDRPLDVSIASSTIALGLVEGLTDLVRDVSGQLRLDVQAAGTGRAPQLTGALTVADAAFVVVPTGARYQRGRADIRLAPGQIVVDALHLEDRDGDPLDLSGSLATQELTVGDLAIDAVARRFELLNDDYGRLEADSRLQIRGQFDRPRLAGSVTVTSGELAVDRILERTLFQPYSTRSASAAEGPLAALNPWDRLGLDVAVHVPNTLRLTGQNVQVAAGTPIGLSDIALRVLGDLYVFKDPDGPAYITGSFDSVSGSFAFQGRTFEVDPTSSINFRGDLNPELYVTVQREISGVQVRVTIAGPLREPELRLASTPPLDSTDILSLIVFNAPANQLTTGQQQELAVRAGALAAGFLAGPLISALQSELGLDILQLETSTAGAAPGARLTIGEEIAPGLVARFSRQFGADPYDEVVIEYYLSRILRLRATFSDAQALNARAPFQQHERGGIDLLLFFSF
ncbi:MAG: translocation/assembly module TamB domain-containing protein [Acidobacteria bacterium]|nr:translocation/assembly module TamB domain-containing protein [Acidobacteriota bacterium]